MDICKGIELVIKENLPQILSLRNTRRLKEDMSFVSDGDLLSQQLILSFINDNISNCKVISEESENVTDDIDKYEYLVTIDPIDGTENFVSGLKEWGVGVSVYKNLLHYQSMIYLPELNETLCTGDKLDRIKDSRICGLSSYMTPSDFEKLGKEYEYRIMGCCMYNMYNVIRGSYCRFQHLKGCYSWDILPGINLALEHGLKVVINGKPYHREFLLPNIKYCFDIY